MSRLHNELSQVIVTVTPKDTSGNAYTPSNARYRVDDCKSEDNLVSWTTISTPSTSMEITIPGSVNTIKDDRCKAETKVLTVNTDQDLDTQHYDQYEYRVKNLAFVDS